ncbi:autotransporter domain-containing protein [Endozoicomonas numazuensis]|uniref:Uncharacterized protein n=1 Tax=Endozoicomonas numazuensis TaxID=1137799 RepID=A0A081NIG6_9GAMM|nr:autotransporter domain-containing protein [Endozoicomonas numazuensis]KEQ18239.1 hypothetical protein GZ78_11965 [Endozoicomonas numazuensis]
MKHLSPFKTSGLKALTLAITGAMTTAALASHPLYKSVYSFGDSLSDTGNPGPSLTEASIATKINIKAQSSGGSAFANITRERFFSDLTVNYLNLDHHNKRGFNLSSQQRRESSSTSGKLYGAVLDAGHALYDDGLIKADPIVTGSYQLAKANDHETDYQMIQLGIS